MSVTLTRNGPSETWFYAAVRYARENGLDTDVVERRFIDAVNLGLSAEDAARYAMDTTSNEKENNNVTQMR